MHFLKAQLQNYAYLTWQYNVEIHNTQYNFKFDSLEQSWGHMDMFLLSMASQ